MPKFVCETESEAFLLSSIDKYRPGFALLRCLTVGLFFGQVRGVLRLLWFGAQQLGAAREKPAVCDGRWPRTPGQTPAPGRSVLLHPLRIQRLPDAARQLPGRGCMWVDSAVQGCVTGFWVSLVFSYSLRVSGWWKHWHHESKFSPGDLDT